MNYAYILLFSIIFKLSTLTLSRISTNNLKVTNGWQFLTKFAFYNYDGYLNLSITYNNGTNSNPYIIVLTADASSWYGLYLNNASCTYNFNMIRTYNVILLGYSTKTGYVSDNTSITLKWENISVVSTKGFYSFIVIFDCSVLQPYYINYQAVLTNSVAMNPFRYQFSVDEFYLLESAIFFGVVYASLILLLIKYKKSLKMEKRFSFLFYLLYLVIWIKFIVFIFQIIIFSQYSLTGYYYLCVFMISELLNLFTLIIFMELILLLAFGLTIVCGKLPVVVICVLASYAIVYFILAIIMTILYINSIDEALVSFIYDNGFGRVLIALQFLMAGIFSLGCFFVIYNYKSRRNFYFLFSISFLFWFISVPILALVANFNIRPYYRFSTVIIVRDGLDLLAHIAYIIITFPGLSSSLVMYTTPSHIIANIPFNEAMENSEDNNNGMGTNNNQFFDISEFQQTRY